MLLFDASMMSLSPLNRDLPSTDPRYRAAILPFHDNLIVDKVYIAYHEWNGAGATVIEWYNATLYDDQSSRITFQVGRGNALPRCGGWFLTFRHFDCNTPTTINKKCPHPVRRAQAWMFYDGRIGFRYVSATVQNALTTGSSATIGMQLAPSVSKPYYFPTKYIKVCKVVVVVV